MPATNVPWPRPSPGESFGSVENLTFARTRFPKSARPDWIPESTIAIVGTDPGFGASQPLQYFATPVSYGHSWFELKPLTCTWTSGVTIRLGSFDRRATSRSRTVAAMPSTRLSRLVRPPRSSSANWLMCVNAESAGEMLPLVLWMITRTYRFGCCLALLTRPGETQVFFGVNLAASRPCFGALAARGTLRTSIAASAVTAPLPPLPQRALDRDSPPRLPVPHSALDRVSLRIPPFLTFRVSFPRPRAVRSVCVQHDVALVARREIRAEPRPDERPATSPGRVRPPKVPSNG